MGKFLFLLQFNFDLAYFGAPTVVFWLVWGFSADLDVLWCLVPPVCGCGGGWLLGDRGVCCSGDGFCGGSLL
jgi:hypothetical protein